MALLRSSVKGQLVCASSDPVILSLSLFAVEVDRALNFIGMPGFFSFNDDGSSDDTVGCSDVDQ